ncbi:MAG: hypothetical protein II039_08855, partial [Treponema sp.]|nr:hypothetical protein [Treponema sp.]
YNCLLTVCSIFTSFLPRNNEPWMATWQHAEAIGFCNPQKIHGGIFFEATYARLEGLRSKTAGWRAGAIA